MLVTGCGCHDVHNSLTWALAEVPQTPELHKDLFKVFRSARDGFDLVHKKLPEWLQEKLSFDDTPTTLCRYFAFGASSGCHTRLLRFLGSSTVGGTEVVFS